MSAQRTAFVTGGSGFLGRHIINLLLDQDWQVTALNRPGSDIAHLQNRGITLADGDVTDKASIAAHMPDGVDAVFHVAADTTQWSRHRARQDHVNIDGTRYMTDVALDKGAGRFLQTSSISAFGCQPGIITEESPSTAPSSPINYERSKYASDNVVREAIDRGLDAVFLNPTAIIGPGDTNNWARSFFIARDGNVPGAPAGGTSTCDVRDVAAAHLSAFETGRTGESYLLGGEMVPYRELLEEISRVVGKELNLRAVPPIFMRLYGRFNSIVGAITGKEPDIPYGVAFMMSERMAVDSTKAQTELDYHQRDWRESLQDSFDWLVEEGLWDA